MPHAMVEGLEPRTMLSATPDQAVLVKDINPGPANSIHMPWLPEFPHSEMAAAGSRVLFGADDGTHGFTLWSSDGTQAGTRMVRRNLHQIDQFTSMRGNAYFVMNGRELWRSDGTSAGTMRLKAFPRPNPADEVVLAIEGTFKTSLVMQYGGEVWTSNGTANGTRLLADIGEPAGDIASMTSVGNRFFFTAGAFPAQLWVSNGTSKATVLVKRIGAYLQNFQALGRNVFFQAEDENGNLTPWISDGSARGTHQARWDVAGGVTLNHRVYFITQKDPLALYSPHYLWAANEALTQRTLVKSFPKGDNTFAMQLACNGDVYFTLDDGVHGVELMKTDGTAQGTVLLKDIRPGGLGSYPDHLTILNGKVLFIAANGTTAGLWSTDGTRDGTQLMRAMTPGDYVDVNTTFNSGRALYITTVDGVVWRSDGTTLEKTGDFDGGRLSPTHFTLAAQKVFFFAIDHPHGAELWLEP